MKLWKNNPLWPKTCFQVSADSWSLNGKLGLEKCIKQVKVPSCNLRVATLMMENRSSSSFMLQSGSVCRSMLTYSTLMV